MAQNNSLRHAKRLIIGVVGATILLLGLVLLVLPGPGFVVIILGLGILATEFVWAKSLLEKAKHHYHKTKHKITNRGKDNNERSKQHVGTSK